MQPFVQHFSLYLPYSSQLFNLITLQAVSRMQTKDRIRKLSEDVVISNRQRARKCIQDSIKTKYSFSDPQLTYNTNENQPFFDLIAEKPKTRSKTIDFGSVQEIPAITSSFSFFQIFDHYYDLGKKIGQGGQSVVYECTNKQNGLKYAVKVTRSDSQEVFRVIERTHKMLKKIDHPNIIKVYDLYVNEDEGVCHMVMQLCAFPDLRDFINKNTANERLKIKILKEISQGIQFLHKNQICHRDIKPQNILFDPLSQAIKIIDFQISKIRQPNNKTIEMWTDTGSLYYRAPQSFGGLYTEQIDVWAIGVIAFELFVGTLPFKSNLIKNTIRKIEKIEIDFDQLNLSPQVLELIKRTLEKQPSARITSTDLVNLKCFNG